MPDTMDLQPLEYDYYTINLPVTGATGTLPGEDDGSIGQAWPVPRFEVDGGVVIDRLTELYWTKNARVALGTLDEVNQYIEEMNAGLADNYGRTDWRLPTWKEFLSLLDRGRINPTLPEGAPFDNVDTSTYYWTGTSHARAIFLYYGHSDNNDRYSPSNMYNLWPVAGTSSINSPYPVIASYIGENGIWCGASRYVDNGDETVTDILIGVMWSNLRDFWRFNGLGGSFRLCTKDESGHCTKLWLPRLETTNYC